MSFVIKKTDDKENTYINMCVFGDYKIGKTYLASTVNNAFIISQERGTLSLSDFSVDYTDAATTITKIKELVKLIKTDESFSKYEWIFLDTITELGQNIYPPLKDKMDKEAIANGSKGSDGRACWGKFGELIGSVIKELRSLDKNICILAHPAFKDTSSGIEKRMPDIYGKSAFKIVGWLDEIYYMHMNDKGERVFLTQTTDSTIAGSRSGKLDKIEPANLGHIQKKILA